MRPLKHSALIAAGAVLVIYLLSGIYTVPIGHVGVVARFGEVIQSEIEPGIHYRLPFPIDRAEIVNVSALYSLPLETGSDARYIDLDPNLVTNLQIPDYRTELLTGDINILTARAEVQYRIVDPVGYLFKGEDPLGWLRAEGQAALAHEVATRNVDTLLTTEKLAVGNAIKETLSSASLRDGVGLQVISVRVEFEPPLAVKADFLSVQDAQSDRVRLIQDAQSYRNEKVPRARGEAAQALSRAQAYSDERINLAQGRAGAFEEILVRYRQSPVTVRSELYLSALTSRLPLVRLVVIDPTTPEDEFRLRVNSP